MATTYYVCNFVDKDEITYSTLKAAKAAYEYAALNMVAKVIYMFGDFINADIAMAAARGLYYVKGVDYRREETFYGVEDLKELQDE